MAYIDSRTPQDRAKSIAGVIAVHGALAYALVIGLKATGVIPTADAPLAGEIITEVPIPPPPPKPEEVVEEAPPTETYVHVPPRELELISDKPIIDIVEIPLPPIEYPVTTFVPKAESTPVGTASPASDAIGPKPRNDTSQWVTTADYRSSWINRELTGVARFRVQVGADGRVKSCTVTGSSGHAALDRATCDLVTRRARFEAGRDTSGEKTSGSYSSAVSWQLPD